MGKVVVERWDHIPPLGLLVKGDQGVFGSAGEVLVAKEGKDDGGGERDAVI